MDHRVQHSVQLHGVLVLTCLVEGSRRGERGLWRQQRFGDLAENAQGAHGFGNVTRVVDGNERGVGEQLDVRRRERAYRLLHDGEGDVLFVVREEERGRVVHESQQRLERRRLRERGRGVEQWELVRRAC